MTDLYELQRSIRRTAGARTPAKASVLAGSLDTFTEAVEQMCGLLREDRRLPIATASFMGVDVFEDARLPANRAVLKLGNEVVAVINLERDLEHSAPNLGVNSPDERPTDGQRDRKDEG